MDSMDSRKMDSKRIQAKGWFLTWPRCSLEKEAALRVAEEYGKISEYVIARETHKDGTPHLHAFIKYEKKVYWKQDKWDLGEHHGNYQVAKCWRAVERYCKKGEDFIANINIEDARQKKAKRNKDLLGMTVCEAIDTGEITLFQAKTFEQCKRIYELNKKEMVDEERVNYWIYGKPGIGKSQWARRNFPKSFKKACNKWWDGYSGEDYVVIDDMDTNILGHYLKIWGDNYSITGEVKGGTVPLTYKQMIITSNYKISELWEQDKMMMEAIARRYKTFTIEGDYNNGYTLKEIDGIYKY